MFSIKQATPTRKNILIQAYEWSSRTQSGIWLPQMLQYSNTRGGKDPWRGKILKIGFEVTQVKAGEIVRYQPGNYYRQTVEENGVRYLILDELLLYAVEDEKENLVRALKDRLVFLPDETLEQKYGHIYLPQTHEEKILYGTIVVAGDGVPLVPGDRVAMENKSTWQFFTSAGKRYILTDKFNIMFKMP